MGTIYTTDQHFHRSNLPAGWAIVANTYNTVLTNYLTSVTADGCTLTFENLIIIVTTGNKNQFLFQTKNGGKIKLGECLNLDEVLAGKGSVYPNTKDSCVYYDYTGSTFDIYQNDKNETNPGGLEFYGGMIYSEGNGDIRSWKGSIQIIGTQLSNVEIYSSYKGTVAFCIVNNTDYAFSDFGGNIFAVKVIACTNLIDDRYTIQDTNFIYRGLDADISTYMKLDADHITRATYINPQFSSWNLDGSRAKLIESIAKSVQINVNHSAKIEQLIAEKVIQNRNYNDDSYEVLYQDYTEREIFLEMERGDFGTYKKNKDFKIKISKLGYIGQEFEFTGLTKETSTTEDKKLNVILEIDHHYSNSAVTDTIDTATQLYDAIARAKVDNLELPNDLLVANGKFLEIKTGWTLVRDQTISSAVVIDETNKKINVKTAESGLDASANFTKFKGGIDSSFVGHTKMLYVLPNGNVTVRINLVAEPGIATPNFAVWLKSQGEDDKTGIKTATSDSTIEVLPNTDYYMLANGLNAYRSEIITINSESYGNIITVELKRLKNKDGGNLLSATLNPEDQKVADMILYNHAEGSIDFKLPANLDTDFRYDDATKMYTFLDTDFFPIAHKVDEIQSSQAAFIYKNMVGISEYQLKIPQDSKIKFRQHVDNPPGVIINLNNFTLKRDPDVYKKQTFLDHSHGVIMANSGEPVIATLSTPESTLDAVVDKIPEKVDEANGITAIQNLIKGLQ